MKSRTHKQGFTLVELMVSLLATAILALTVGILLQVPIRSLSSNREYTRLRRDLSVAVKTMARDIRMSSFSGVAVAPDSLTLQPNSVMPNGTSYTRNAGNGSLSHAGGTGSMGPIITEGLTRFDPVLSTNGLNGVLLNLEMQNDDGDIVITHQTFIHTRN